MQHGRTRQYVAPTLLRRERLSKVTAAAPSPSGRGTEIGGKGGCFEAPAQRRN